MVWGRKSYLEPAKIAFFSSRDLSRSNKHDSFWLVVLTGYLYIFVFMSHCCFRYFSLGNLVLPLSSITFTANSQADDRFYKYIYLFQILYSMK